MEEFFMNILYKVLDYIIDFVSPYSYFITFDYYKNMFIKYFSVVGFIVGFVFLVFVLLSSSEQEDKTSFFKVVPVIAVINGCYFLSKMLTEPFGESAYYQGANLLQEQTGLVLNAPDNIISGFILVLIVTSCYKNLSRPAFFLSLSTFLAVPMMQFAGYEEINIAGFEDERFLIDICIRFGYILVISIVFAVIAHRKYFYTGWILYFVFYMLARIAVFIAPIALDCSYGVYYSVVEVLETNLMPFLEYLASFKVDAAVFALILLFAIIFEKQVLLTAKKSAAATA